MVFFGHLVLPFQCYQRGRSNGTVEMELYWLNVGPLACTFSVDSLVVLGGCFVLEGVSREKLKSERFAVCFVSVESWFHQNGKILKAWNFSGETKSVSIMPSGGHGTCSVSITLSCVTCYMFSKRCVCKKQEELKLLFSEKLGNVLKAQMSSPLDQCVLRDVHTEAVLSSTSAAWDPRFLLVIWMELWLGLFPHLTIEVTEVSAEPACAEHFDFHSCFRPGEAQESSVPFCDSTGRLCWCRGTSSARGV